MLRECDHKDGRDDIVLTPLEKELGYRVVRQPKVVHSAIQLQALDTKGHVVMVRPASRVEVELYERLVTAWLTRR